MKVCVLAEPGRLFTRWNPEEAHTSGMEERAHRQERPRPNQAMCGSFQRLARGQREGERGYRGAGRGAVRVRVRVRGAGVDRREKEEQGGPDGRAEKQRDGPESRVCRKPYHYQPTLEF